MNSVQTYLKTIAAVLFISCICSFAQDSKGSTPAEKILQQVEKKKGFRPYPLRLMAERKGTLPSFMKYGNGIFENGPLTDKEVYLIALSAAVSLNSPTCIQAHTRSAMENGATREEIIQTILVSGVISNTAPLHIAGENALKVLNQK